MKAKELAEILMQDPDRIVVIAGDGEGNWFGELHDYSKYLYDKENHEIGIEELTKELEDEGYTEDDIVKDGIKAFVLWP